MTLSPLNALVLLAGLFVVPILLLWRGHRLRRQSSRLRRAFWGALTGHCVAATLATVVSMLPPESWNSDDQVRGLLALWSLVLLPALGWTAGYIFRRDGEEPSR